MTPGSKPHFSSQREQSIKPHLWLMQRAQDRVTLSVWRKNEQIQNNSNQIRRSRTTDRDHDVSYGISEIGLGPCALLFFCLFRQHTIWVGNSGRPGQYGDWDN